MATIKAIESRSVHQIQSGQVIVDLCSVVKELVENSLDAGATSVDIRFRNHGLEAIEVSDNGKGIASDDFETIALKHYTSKLSSYEDLTSLDTFGFRGEALSSLCALSKFHIVTAQVEDGPKGRRLEFEISGKLKNQSIVAAQKGTTVFIEDLFYNLPVRRKELEKNIKREYGKVINLLQAYACIGVGVRFSVSNQMPKARKTAVFSTKTNATTKDNIANVYGAKTLLALAKLELKLEMLSNQSVAVQSARGNCAQELKSLEVLVQGHISRPIFGEGRNAPDRQMFFVNSRPCLLPQVSKAINEVYKSFNVSQSPFIFANLIMDTNAYDVNVSPDKRTILLHDQTALLERLKVSLTDMFDNTNHTMPQTSLPSKKLPAYQPLIIQDRKVIHGPFIESSPDSTSESLAGDSRPEKPADSLIAQWTSRDSEVREPALSIRREIQSRTSKPDQEPSRSNEATVRAFLDKNAVIMGETAKHRREDTGASFSLNLEQNDIAPQCLPELISSSSDSDIEPPVSTAALELPPQEPIQALSTSSQKSVPGAVQNAFDRMRPKRTPKQTANITIGDITTTTTIGTGPPSKRQRVHAPKNSQAIAAFGCSPALARDLRGFAAPGTETYVDSSDHSDIADFNREATGKADEEDDGTDKSVDSSFFNESSGDELIDTSMQSLSRRGPQNKLADESQSEELYEVDDVRPTHDDSYEEYIDEHESKIREDEKIARLIQKAEATAARPTELNLRRVSQSLKNSTGRKDSTYQLATSINTSIPSIQHKLANLRTSVQCLSAEGSKSLPCDSDTLGNFTDEPSAESKLSLTVLKEDFSQMAIVGQFNLGFILAARPASQTHRQDELFIIDQHAADEKYNYEKLQRSVIIQSQRLVRPKLLELSAVEEELVLNNQDALKANGFEINVEVTSEEESTHRYFRLLTLPVSKEKTFELSDLEELLHLLSERPPGSPEIPRPKKVQRMLAMRACRSSIMVGKTLTRRQMEKVVRNMGEMDKPWNCPHGRPTMRHLAGLGAWSGWKEEELVHAGSEMPSAVNWKAWLNSR